MLKKIEVPGGTNKMATYTSIMEELMELNEILILDNFQWDMADAIGEQIRSYENSLCASF